MPFGSVDLIVGVNVERTPTLLRAGYSQSSFGRFKDGLFQKIGGWTKFFTNTIGGIPRALHAWQDLNGVDQLMVGTTTELGVIANSALTDITPQTKTTNPTLNFSTTTGSATITIVDTGISGVTIYDSIYFNTPVSVSGVILSGLYPIVSIGGATQYTITAQSLATGSVSTGGAVPVFATTTGSPVVSVAFPAHGEAVGDISVFPISTSVGGTSVNGSYTVTSVADVNDFSITTAQQASSATTASMNGGLAQIVYYLNIGPPAAGVGFGVGAFGAGGFGTGVVPTGQTGAPITATDWTLDNWGKLAIACPKNGGIYYWDPNGGFQNAGLVSTGPIFNSGIFVSMTTQILIAYGSTVSEGIGVQQDPMTVKWSNLGDFTQWAENSESQAGEFRIPIGSMIVGGMPIALKNLIWTDLDLWAMTYVGPPYVFGFDKIGAGAGLAGAHAAGQLRGNVYWMGQSNFYVLSGNGVQVLPCAVWDYVFQDLDTDNIAKVRACPNTPFNEMMWEFPSLTDGTGENSRYVKINITEPGQPWDYGSLPRSAWIDQSVLGPPIGASPSSIIYQHETTNDADGSPLTSSFTTGYFYIAEGEDYSIVDQIIPDFKFGTIGANPNATIQLTFNVVNYLGDTPRTYGPYSVTSTTEYITTRFRGRQMSVTAESNDLGSFWRIGHIRYRYSSDGRR